jgi:DDE superfamily endonuclease
MDPDNVDPLDPGGFWAQAHQELIADAEEDEERHRQAVLAAAIALFQAQSEEGRRERKFKYNNERVNWPELVAKLEHTDSFKTTFRMSRLAFEDLVETLGDRIEINYIKSLNSMPESNDRIFPELVVAVGLRCLIGGKPDDIKLWAGISKSSVYRIKDLLLDAIIGTEAMAVEWPDTADKCWLLAQKFKNLSSHGVMDKVVGCLDGILIPIRQPPDVENPRAYYSGHYKRHGINVQVVCDADLRILYYSIRGTGTSFVVCNCFMFHSSLTIPSLRQATCRTLLPTTAVSWGRKSKGFQLASSFLLTTATGRRRSLSRRIVVPKG